jgi:PD-(D/E)XK nuclease superfamily
MSEPLALRHAPLIHSPRPQQNLARTVSTTPSLSTALAALSRSIDERRLAHATTLQTTAPLFTPFTYLRRGEYGISKIIGDLLDPNGEHSQGPLFLSLFLKMFGFQSLEPISVQADVAMESPTADGGRIDIVIRDKTWIIGIENKPWARDGELQVTAYLKEIRSCGCRSAYLIYLTKDGRPPSASSINQRECQRAMACGDLRLASYTNILTWLGGCYDRCGAERVRRFLSDFRDYIRGAVMNDQAREPYNPVVDSLLAEDTRKYLGVALEIAGQKDSIRDALLKRLFAGLRERLPGWSITGTPMTADDGLALTPPDAKRWFFCVELESEAGKWFYGLKFLEPQSSKDMADLGKRLRSRFRDSGGSNRHWLIWLWFENRTAHDPASYCQWEDNVQPWIEMADGRMADNLASLATELHDAAIELSRR